MGPTKRSPHSVSSSHGPLMLSSQEFPIVGIGASAGGLEALIAFFESTPADLGAAYVIVMHLSPTHESNADAVLQRATRMPVIAVTKPIHVERNTVYVISPNLYLEMNDGYLRVRDRKPGGLPVAIDQFMRTLAITHRQHAVAVILSGTGVDGISSLSMIKDQGGVVFVQDPQEAGHSGMPRAAIETGLADFVLPVVQMANKLAMVWRNANDIHLAATNEDEAEQVALPKYAHEESLRDILGLLRIKTGNDFSKYKRATVLRRIERRLQVRELHDLGDYLSLLRQDASEGQALLADMLIGVTQFFRDREAFDAIERDVIPELFRERQDNDMLRVWSVACSTGQETYSLAMLLSEHAERLNLGYQFQVFGTDIDERAIGLARAGIYPPSIVDDVGEARLDQHFIKEEGRYRIRKPLRDTILFACQNILRDPPFSKLDLISCRNLLIYLNRDTHSQVLEMFHFALKPNGYLFLGSSESADILAEFFVPVDKKNRLYRARPMSRFPRSAIPMAVAPIQHIVASNVVQAEKNKFSYASVHQRLLAEYAPPSVLIDHQSSIVHLSEGTHQFLRHAAGEPSRNLLTLVEPELRLELRTAVFQAIQSGKSVETRRISMVRADRTFHVNMTARPVYDVNTSTDFVLVLFHKVELTTEEQVIEAEAVRDDTIFTGLEEELRRVKAQLQDTIEHSETSNEELKASNEELQAINEELRSATEELETSKEELQSVNEELVTVNFELKNKVEEAGKANDDLQNLITSTDIATIFVDRNRRIKRYTPHAADLFNLIPGDAGRPLHDITHKLDYPDLALDAIKSFETLSVVEREVSSNDGRSFIARILPYRTAQDRIEGAVLTFIDITGRRKAEDRMRSSEERMRLVAASTKDYAIMTMDCEGKITSFNSGAEKNFGYTAEEIIGQPGSIIYTAEDQAAGVPELEKRRAREEGRAEDERWHQRKDGSRFFCSGVMTPLTDSEFLGYAKIGRDLTGVMERDKQRTQQLSIERDRRAEAQSHIALKDEFLAVMSHELKHPLNLIHLNADLICRLTDAQTSPMLSRAAEVIRSSTISQAKIINDLLDLSRLKTGKMAVNRQRLDLNIMTQTIYEVVQTDPISASLQIVYSESENPLWVFADQTRIEQVIWNLVNNAIKFTPAGGTIHISLAAEKEYARLDVSDNGQGIASEFLPKVFDMFGQGTPSLVRGTKGLGIGLSMVQQIVTLHEGRVEATSEGSGQGSCFTVWLPMDRRQRERETDNAVGGKIPLEGVRIMLVDDNEDVMEVFSQLLQFAGATVQATTSPHAALKLLEVEDVDLLISDIGMPEMDGLTFIKAVRGTTRGLNLPAIAVTGFGRQADIEKALAAGFNSHVNKPVDVDQLASVARSLLHR